jgi:hypothetical protein
VCLALPAWESKLSERSFVEAFDAQDVITHLKNDD